MAEAQEYVERAATRIRAVLDEHGAVVHPELLARIAEGYYESSGENIDPHHVTEALRDLRRGGHLTWVTGPTRGGHRLQTIQPTDRTRRATKIDTAAARKRALLARYTGWSQGTKRHPQGLVGPAGEAATRRAILDSNALQPATQGAGETTRLLGTTLPGPADSAGYLVPLNRGIPTAPVTLIFEVKNIRSWIYPRSEELYQVLHKASVLRAAQPGQLIIPILVCRKAHITSFWMAKQLGFIVIDTGRQWAGDVHERELLEVRNELHFHDLHAGSEPSARVRDRLRDTLPRIAISVADEWARTCAIPGVPDTIDALRRAHDNERETLMSHLRELFQDQGYRGGW